MTSSHQKRALSITAAMLLGFALTIAVWLAAGYGLTVRIEDTQRRAAEATARYVAAQDLLSGLNDKVLLGSVYIRDALLDAGSPNRESHLAVEQTYQAVTRMLGEYVPVFDSSTERERLGRLRQEIDDFRRGMLGVLDAASNASAREARVILRTQVVPRRDVVIRVSEEVQALNREAFVRQQGEIAEIYSASQRWFWLTLSVAILASFGIALAAIRYAGRLEGRLQHQLVLDAENAKELQHLSARLITVQEEERRVIARELHDEVGQSLTAIKVELSLAGHALQSAGLDPGILADARAISDGALTTIRDLSHLLHPSVLDDLGLPAAVEAYVSSFGQRHQIKARVEQQGVYQRLAPDVETSIYRIIQEALTNVAKHAHATACHVSLTWSRRTISVVIEDNGVGFDVAGQVAKGLGLVGIRERLLEIDGTLRVESARGKGTKLTIELPATLREPFAEESAPDHAVTDSQIGGTP